MRSVTCKKLFDSWRYRLEEEREVWLIRDVVHGLIAWNQAARLTTGITTPVATWEDAAMRIFHKDVPRVEDAYSLALKTMNTQTSTVRFKLEPHRLAPFFNVYQPVSCTHCRRRCSVVLVMASPCGSEQPSDVLSE